VIAQTRTRSIDAHKKPRAKAGLAHHIDDSRLLSGSAFPSDDALSPYGTRDDGRLRMPTTCS